MTTQSQAEELQGRISARETLCPKLFTPKSWTWVWLLLRLLSAAVKEEEVHFSFTTPYLRVPLAKWLLENHNLSVTLAGRGNICYANSVTLVLCMSANGNSWPHGANIAN